jgi:hypothetical protein
VQNKHEDNKKYGYSQQLMYEFITDNNKKITAGNKKNGWKKIPKVCAQFYITGSLYFNMDNKRNKIIFKY